MRKYVLSLVTVILPIIIAYGWTSRSVDTSPPSLNIGAQLYKGQISANGILNFDDGEKQISAAVSRSSAHMVVTKSGINFYHVEKDLSLADLLDYAKCINANVDKLIFFTYSPGSELGMQQKGFYLYPPDLADNSNNFGINDKNQFTIGKGRVFGLYTENEAVSSCFRDATTVSLVNLTDNVKNSKPGWLQIPAKSLNLSETLSPVKNCLKSIWIQDGVNSFSKIAIGDIDSYSLKSFVTLWLEIKECKEDVTDQLVDPVKKPPEAPVSEDVDPVVEPDPVSEDVDPVLPIFNVKEAPFLAKGDGENDDGPAIQKALDAISSNQGGGKIFIPEGTYFINQTLILGSNTEIYGEGKKTVLMRGSKTSYRSLWGAMPKLNANGNVVENHFYDTKGDRCAYAYGTLSLELFANALYNCGNENIFLHDFAIDGSKVVIQTVEGSKVYKYNFNTRLHELLPWTFGLAGTISFSGTKNLKVQHLFISDVPQDAIFIRGGGVDTIISDNVIDGHNMLWYNGGGINVEMWWNSNNLTPKDGAPVKVHNNTIYTRAPGFCQHKNSGGILNPQGFNFQCSKDADCTSGFMCSYSEIVSIAGGTQPADFASVDYAERVKYNRMSIVDNTIYVTNKHSAIITFSSWGNEIRNNIITFIDRKSEQDEIGGLFIGIHASSAEDSGLVVVGNKITGSNYQGDRRGIWLLGYNSKSLLVEKNIIKAKNTEKPIFDLSGYLDYVVQDNIFDYIVQPNIYSGGITLGQCNNPPTISGIFRNNFMSSLPVVRGYASDKSDNIVFENNYVNDVQATNVIKNNICLENKNYHCFDKLDNDWDGKIDCADDSCNDVISSDNKNQCKDGVSVPVI